MNEPQSLHELHQEDAEEERKRIAKFDRMAEECRNVTWLSVDKIAKEVENLSDAVPLFSRDIVVLTHALWSAVRANGNLHILANRQIIESLEEVMLICQERIDQDLIDASDSLEAREKM